MTGLECHPAIPLPLSPPPSLDVSRHFHLPTPLPFLRLRIHRKRFGISPTKESNPDQTRQTMDVSRSSKLTVLASRTERLLIVIDSSPDLLFSSPPSVEYYLPILNYGKTGLFASDHFGVSSLDSHSFFLSPPSTFLSFYSFFRLPFCQ